MQAGLYEAPWLRGGDPDEYAVTLEENMTVVVQPNVISPKDGAKVEPTKNYGARAELVGAKDRRRHLGERLLQRDQRQARAAQDAGLVLRGVRRRVRRRVAHQDFGVGRWDAAHRFSCGAGLARRGRHQGAAWRSGTDDDPHHAAAQSPRSCCPSPRSRGVRAASARSAARATPTGRAGAGSRRQRYCPVVSTIRKRASPRCHATFTV